MSAARLLVFDLETYRTRDKVAIARVTETAMAKKASAKVLEEMKESGQVDDEVTLKAFKSMWDSEDIRDARIAKAVSDTALDVTLAEPILCGWRAVMEDNEDEYPIVVDQLAWEPSLELKQLSDLFSMWSEIVTQDTIWVGFNHEGYDLPILLNRARLLGVRPPEHFPQWVNGHWRGRVYDLMRRTVSKKPEIPVQYHFKGMEEACRMCGVPLRDVMWDGDPIDGSRVGEIYETGGAAALNALLDYCHEDVRGNLELYKRQTFDDTWGTYDRGFAEQVRAVLDSETLTVGEKGMALYSLESTVRNRGGNG